MMATVSVIESPSPAALFIDHFIECIDSLPDDVQRNVSKLRELDLLYRAKLSQVSNLLESFHSTDDQTIKQRYLTKIQRCLVKSQEYGDEKLQIISQIGELAENKNIQMLKDVERIESPMRRNVSPLLPKTEQPVTFEEHRSMGDRHNAQNNKRPRRQKTTNERFVDIQERLIKPEKVSKPEKAPKSEKSTKSEKKTKASDKSSEKVVETLVEVSSVLRNPVIETTTTTKKDKESSKKEKEVIAMKKKTVKQKDTKKKNGTVKKKKKKEIEEIPIDPDEPTYCSCNQVSYGEMIGCDNEECPIEWFHFSCVNLTTKPKGKWYCPQCTIERREKGKK